MQQGRIAEAETSARRLWGTAKLESALADLKESNSDAGASEDASWGDLFSRRYRKGGGVSGPHYRITNAFFLAIFY